MVENILEETQILNMSDTDDFLLEPIRDWWAVPSGVRSFVIKLARESTTLICIENYFSRGIRFITLSSTLCS